MNFALDSVIHSESVSSLGVYRQGLHHVHALASTWLAAAKLHMHTYKIVTILQTGDCHLRTPSGLHSLLHQALVFFEQALQLHKLFVKFLQKLQLGAEHLIPLQGGRLFWKGNRREFGRASTCGSGGLAWAEPAVQNAARQRRGEGVTSPDGDSEEPQAPPLPFLSFFFWGVVQLHAVGVGQETSSDSWGC